MLVHAFDDELDKVDVPIGGMRSAASRRYATACASTVVPVDLSEIMAAAERVSENEKGLHEKLALIQGSIQKNYGCATRLSMSIMGEEGKPSAREADITGAISMLALRLASGSAAGFLDWNNNYGVDRNKCIANHCSNFPMSFFGQDIEISELDVLGESLGTRDRGAVIWRKSF